MKNFTPRLLRLGLAWVCGFLIYMLGVMVTGVYDGFPSLVCQPPIAFFVSALFTMIAAVIGLVITHTGISRIWSKSPAIAVCLIIIGLILLFFSQQLGLVTQLINPETNQQFEGPNPIAVATGYFLLLFSIVNWPERNQQLGDVDG